MATRREFGVSLLTGSLAWFGIRLPNHRWHGVKTGQFYKTDASESFPEIYDAMRREADRRGLSWI